MFNKVITLFSLLILTASITQAECTVIGKDTYEYFIDLNGTTAEVLTDGAGWTFALDQAQSMPSKKLYTYKSHYALVVEGSLVSFYDYERGEYWFYQQSCQAQKPNLGFPPPPPPSMHNSGVTFHTVSEIPLPGAPEDSDESASSYETADYTIHYKYRQYVSVHFKRLNRADIRLPYQSHGQCAPDAIMCEDVYQGNGPDKFMTGSTDGVQFNLKFGNRPVEFFSFEFGTP